MKAAVAVLGLLAVAAGLAVWQKPELFAVLSRQSATGSAQPPSAGGTPAAGRNRIAVETAVVEKSRLASDIRAVGSLQSDESVQLAPEIAGRVSEIVFSEGTPVKKGDTIFKLDDSLQRAAVTQATAALKLAEANNDRAKALSRTGNVTERARDEATTTFETARAELELARTRLDKHVIRAPFDGVAGVRRTSAGAFVNAGTAIVSIEKLDTLKVDFKVPEVYLKDIRVGQEIEVRVDAIIDRAFKGEIYAVDPSVDVNGRALQVRARLDNREMVLRPGLFARITVKGLADREVAVIPESAVLPRSGASYVFTIVDGKAVEKRVELGERRDGRVEIVQGLDAGETIAIAGQQRLKNGSAVEVVPAARNGAPTDAAPPAKPLRDGGRA